MADISTYIDTLENAIYGEEVRGALIALAEGFHERVGDGIYIANYDETSYEELLAAFKAGKMILAKRNHVYFTMMITPAHNTGRVSFVGFTNSSSVLILTCTQNSVWSYSATPMATQSWVTSKINTAIDSAVTAAIEGSY